MRFMLAALAFACAAFPIQAQDGENADPVKKQYAARLSTLKVTLDFKDATLEDVVSYLRDVSDMNFFIDRSAKDKGDIRITIKVADLALGNVLNLMLKPQGLACVYKDGVLLVMAEGQEDVKMEIYDVRDLLFPIQQFPGIDIALTDDEVNIIPAPPDDPQELPVVDLIKAHTGGKSWDENPKTSISLAGGLLVVKQTAAVHAEVRRMILKLRDFK